MPPSGSKIRVNTAHDTCWSKLGLPALNGGCG